jgi:hypothetical protein
VAAVSRGLFERRRPARGRAESAPQPHAAGNSGGFVGFRTWRRGRLQHDSATTSGPSASSSTSFTHFSTPTQTSRYTTRQVGHRVLARVEPACIRPPDRLGGAGGQAPRGAVTSVWSCGGAGQAVVDRDDAIIGGMDQKRQLTQLRRATGQRDRSHVGPEGSLRLRQHGLGGPGVQPRETAMDEVRRSATQASRSPTAQRRASPEYSTRRGAAAAKR